MMAHLGSIKRPIRMGPPLLMQDLPHIKAKGQNSILQRGRRFAARELNGEDFKFLFSLVKSTIMRIPHHLAIYISNLMRGELHQKAHIKQVSLGFSPISIEPEGDDLRKVDLWVLGLAMQPNSKVHPLAIQHVLQWHRAILLLCVTMWCTESLKALGAL